MAIGADDFRVRGGSAADRADLDAALRYLSQSPMGGAIMQKAALKGTDIQIVHDGRDRYDPRSDTIYWDPDAAHVVDDARGRPAALQSSAMGLLHEGVHAVDPDIHRHIATPDRQFGTHAEAYAIEAENVVAADLGEPGRYRHEGLPRRIDDPTAHTPMPSDPSASLDALVDCMLRMYLKC